MRHRQNGGDMKSDPDEMLPEYDFSDSVVNPYPRGHRMSEVICLDADVAQVFTDSRSVNDALRPLAEILRKKRLRAG